MSGVFVGFGFGAIQGGLFLPAVQRSGNFDRIIIAEIESDIIEGVRANKGRFACNVAHDDRVELVSVENVEVLNPLDPDNRETLIQAVAEAKELVTALPSFRLYNEEPAPAARLLAEGLTRKCKRPDLSPAVVYAAENDMRAAARLEAFCWDHAPSGFGEKVVFSETVIPKMCSVVTDHDRMEKEELIPMYPGSNRAILVEAYDGVMIDAHHPPGFERGLDGFSEKTDLDPFAHAKFIGHNAVHAWLGYMAQSEGMTHMGQLNKRGDLMRLAGKVFLEEVGPGLIHAHSRTGDSLFTESGLKQYAQSALKRMINPFLNDPIDRVTRDPVRKLGWDDRLLGAMRLAREAGVEPNLLAQGARLALDRAVKETHKQPADLLDRIWPQDLATEEKAFFRSLLLESA
jgi:mannitol-1-phosphate 5-dehydrogenase